LLHTLAIFVQKFSGIANFALIYSAAFKVEKLKINYNPSFKPLHKASIFYRISCNIKGHSTIQVYTLRRIERIIEVL